MNASGTRIITTIAREMPVGSAVRFPYGHILTIINNASGTVTIPHNPAGFIYNKASASTAIAPSEAIQYVFLSSVWHQLDLGPSGGLTSTSFVKSGATSSQILVGDGTTILRDICIQATPTAKTATATLTIAEILTDIITVTSATAVSLTLPTGTLTDAGVYSGTLAVNDSFQWNIINLGTVAGAVTLVASTAHTIVGSAVVAISTSATFRTRKTATNTFVTYRIN